LIRAKIIPDRRVCQLILACFLKPFGGRFETAIFIEG
jgi:hypothetical protein